MGKATNIIFLAVVILTTASCSHHRSGRYVYSNGKWVFETSQIGFLNAKSFNAGRVDNSPYEYKDYGNFIWPVPGSKKVSSFFGKRGSRHHDGVDIPAVSGTNIVASADGQVVYSGKMRGYGNIIVIKHDDGYHTVYAHNRKHFVKKGNKVSQGEVIGLVGSSGRSSGPHLHFEIRRNNKVRNPALYLSRMNKYLVNK